MRIVCAVLFFLLASADVAVAQDGCPRSADSLVVRGWELYRRGAIDSAGVAFGTALARCPAHLGATVGDGYAQLRSGNLETAARRFGAALDRDPHNGDAAMGIGLIAWRRGELDAARTAFQRVLAADSTRAEAREYLARIGVPPERSPLVIPDTVEIWARANGDRFERLEDGAWHPLYVKGVNLGAALPGRFPSEFPDSAVYADWIAQIAGMGANTVRVYTIHPPAFYGALAQHNAAHPDSAVWIIHGVWTELPPAYDFDDAAWGAEYAAEMRRVVDVLHGRADVPARPGHASGFYSADVSPWTLAYIIGREWEPYAVQVYDAGHPAVRDWQGQYLSVAGGSPMDVWLAQMCDRLIAYESETYRVQRPVAYTSWPTLDPLYHVTEASIAEDMTMRGVYADTQGVVQHDEDVATVDPTLLRPTPAFRAGVFAAYHAYPYYPDFIVLDGGYAAYLRRLKDRHPGMPVVIAEYGVPASLGIAHLAPEGWHHGGHPEAEMAAIDAELTRVVASSGMAGGILFAWIDEWFKRNWLVFNLEAPQERSRLWLSRMNPEQQYGVLAMEPAPRLDGGTLAERLTSWAAVPPMYGGRLRALADEAYLWLLVDPGTEARPDSVLIGLDMLDPGTGSFRWPGRHPNPLPVGVEFVLAATPTEVRVLADRGANPFRVRPQSPFRVPLQTVRFSHTPPGFFAGAYDQVYNLPLGRQSSTTGHYDSLRVVTNRTRIGRDTVEHAAAGYEWGFLPPGGPPDGFWEIDSTTGAVEIRVPWTLINVADPSSRQILTSADGGGAGFRTVPADAIRILLAARTRDGNWLQWPSTSDGDAVATFTWDPWEEPRWRSRRRPTYDAMRDVFRTLEPVGLLP